ncbi:hypothetical protein GCM10011351_12610 [Paraliobacillus quinghaiensis]|uniref:Apea-like HEPN domain-containing protein n=1 Tax=Paraliobacillus quinghaiensis TaxID=470815 RepID=A0A917TN11_9BACI|nr:hypothetical protein [Paraliobacillus quinghaiensis]GGM28184.1 hypothetical protein GCM10011351_12610 [Paraliobacillus quinghaiensis]
MKKLAKKVLYLLRFNQDRNQWNCGLEDKETWRIITAIADHNDFSEIIDIEDAEDWILNIFNWLDLHNKEELQLSDAYEVLRLLKNNLETNVKDYWVIFPLVNATLGSTINISDGIYIVGGEEEDILEQLHGITKLPLRELEGRFEHTIRTRSSAFISHPVMAIKKHHQFSSVNRMASDSVFYAISILNVLYRAKIYPQYENTRISLAMSKLLRNRGDSRELDKINKHITVHGEKNWRHIPINFNYTCNFNLEWLKQAEYKSRFIELYNWTQNRDDIEELKVRFLRALKFFIKAMNFGKIHNSFDSESDTVLYLNISAEVMLLKKNEDKRNVRKDKLTFLLDNLVNVNSDQKESFENVCKSRNEFVHDGLEYIDDYFYRNELDPFINDAKGKTDLDIFIKVIATLISKADLYIEFALNNKKHSNFNVKESWFNLLKESYDGNNILITDI